MCVSGFYLFINIMFINIINMLMVNCLSSYVFLLYRACNNVCNLKVATTNKTSSFKINIIDIGNTAEVDQMNQCSFVNTCHVNSQQISLSRYVYDPK